MKRISLRNEPVLFVLVLSLVSLLGLTQPAHADGSASVLVHAGPSDDVADSMTASTSATAHVSGGRTFGINQSHIFGADASGNGASGQIAVSTQQLTNRWSGIASATGSVFDTVTFHGPGSTPRQVEFTMSVIGGFFNIGGPSAFIAQADLSMTGIGSSLLKATWTDTPGSLVNYLASSDVTLLGASNEPQQIQGTLHVQGVVSPGDVVMVSASLFLQTAPGSGPAVQADSLFNHTAQLGVTLPEGWSFTSESGTFLTQVAATSPEPNSLLLFALILLPGAIVMRYPKQDEKRINV